MILRRIVVELPQTPEDDPQKWKSDELVTVGACVWLVTAMVGWVGAGMEVVDGMHAGQSRWGGGRLSEDAGALPEREVVHR